MEIKSFCLMTDLLEYVGSLNRFIHVAAVGSLSESRRILTRLMVKGGYSCLNPVKGARGHDVTNLRNLAFVWGSVGVMGT